MTSGLPGLLQLWGIVLISALFIGSYLVALAWHRRRPDRPKIHLDVAAIALLAFLTGGFFWRVLTESGIMMPAGGGDLASLYYPNYAYAAHELQRGSIPLWNPYLFSGMPFAADVQSGLFYPLNWIVFALQVNLGHLEWLLIFHYWVAATFTYLFLRDIGLRRVGALTGGVVFAFCGFMTAHLGHLPMVLVATWIPCTLLLLRRALTTQGRTGWACSIGAGLSLTMSLFAGHVQIFSYGLLAAALLWLLHLFNGEPLTRQRALPIVLKGALPVVLALLIGAVQLLPSLQLSAESVRASVSYEEASDFPAQPLTLLNLFLPQVYGSNPTNYSLGPWQTTENWSYSGVVTLALAAAGLVLRRTRMLAFFALLALLALVLMVGDLSIVGAWIYKFLPGFSKLRDPGRALVLIGLGLAGLSAYGIDALVSHFSATASDGKVLFRWLIGLSGVLALLVLGVMPALFIGLLTNSNAIYSHLPPAINGLGMLLIWLGAAAAICWAALRGRVQPRVAGWFLFVLVVLDIFSPNSRFNPTTTDILSGYEHFDMTSFLYKYTHQVAGEQGTGVATRVDIDPGVEDIWQPSSALIAESGGAPFYTVGGAFNPLMLARYNRLWQAAEKNVDSPLYDLIGAGVQVVPHTVTHVEQPKWALVQSFPNYFIYRNKNALPRVFLVHDARVEPDDKRLIELLDLFGANPLNTVLLGQGTNRNSPSNLPGTAQGIIAGKPTGEKVQATSYDTGSLAIHVSAKAPGWVVLTDAYYPGWEATVDHTPTEIVPADYAYRAVHIDAGEHDITMQFRPASWLYGRIISVLSLVGAVAGLLLTMWPRRRKARKTVLQAN
ncbi:MAG: YfhO family protein [Chloroflexota bacterium]|nr:YfhO family protein [Chloroflexota bacterium]